MSCATQYNWRNLGFKFERVREIEESFASPEQRHGNDGWNDVSSKTITSWMTFPFMHPEKKDELRLCKRNGLSPKWAFKEHWWGTYSSKQGYMIFHISVWSFSSISLPYYNSFCFRIAQTHNSLCWWGEKNVLGLNFRGDTQHLPLWSLEGCTLVDDSMIWHINNHRRPELELDTTTVLQSN